MIPLNPRVLLVLLAIVAVVAVLSCGVGSEDATRTDANGQEEVQVSVGPETQERLAGLCRTLNPPGSSPADFRNEIPLLDGGRLVCRPSETDTVPQVWVPQNQETKYERP